MPGRLAYFEQFPQRVAVCFGHCAEALEAVVREQHGHVLVLRLNRPEARNALDSAMIGELGAAIRDAEEGDDIRVLVVTGTGDRAFCSGMDLRSFSEGDTPSPGAEATSGNFMRLMRGEVTVPVIAAVQASAVAGGFEIAVVR